MKKIISLSVITLVLVGTACKKKSAENNTVDPRIPPDMTLKTGTNYTAKDTTVIKQDTLYFGVILTKTEDNLTSFNGSYSYDGVVTTSSFYNHYMIPSEYTGVTLDFPYYTRNQAGTEKLTFAVVDRDGNITKKTILVTVQ